MIIDCNAWDILYFFLCCQANIKKIVKCSDNLDAYIKVVVKRRGSYV